MTTPNLLAEDDTPPPTQITADDFRALLAKVNAPADFVEEELKRWRTRGLILLEPADRMVAFLTEIAEELGQDYWDDVYESATDMALAALQRGVEIAQSNFPTLSELEKVIENMMNSGNDITPYEIAVSVRDRFINTLDFYESVS